MTLLQLHQFKCKRCLLRWEQWVGYDDKVPILQCPDCKMGVDSIDSSELSDNTLVRLANWQKLQGE